MKRNIKALIASVLALALIVGLYVIAVKLPESNENEALENEQEQYEENDYLVDVEISDIDYVEFKNGDEEYVIKNAEPPYIVGDTSRITDTSSVITAIYVAAGIMVSHEIENPTDLSAYGLDREDKTFRVKMKDGSEHLVIIGNNAAFQGEYYVMNKGTGRIVTVSENVALILTRKKGEYKSLEIPTVDNEKIKAVTIEKAGKKELTIKASANESEVGGYSNYYVIDYPYEGAEIDVEKVKNLFDVITAPEVMGIVDENPKNLSKYGLDKPYVLTVTDNSKTVSYKMGKYATGGSVYLMCDDVPAVYTAYCDFYETVKEVKADEYADKFIHLFTRKEIESVLIESGKDSYTLLEKDGKNERLINGKAVSEETFGEVFQNVVGLYASEFTDKTPSGKEKCKVTFTFKDKKKKTFTYYIYNERVCMVRSDSNRNCLILTKDIDAVLDALAK